MTTHDEMIAVIAAHRDGKAIEHRCPSVSKAEWKPLRSGKILPVLFNFDDFDYRIKREPREFSLIVTPYGNFYPADAELCPGWERIKVREVIEEGEAK